MISLGPQAGRAEVEDAMGYLRSPEQDTSEIIIDLWPACTQDEDPAEL